MTPGGDARAFAPTNSDPLTLLGFLSSGCTSCAGFWQALQQADGLELPQGTRVVIVTKGPELEIPAQVRSLSTGRVPVIMSTEAWHDYQVPGSPFFVLIDGASGRKVGQGVAAHVSQLVDLVHRARFDEERGRGSARRDRLDGPGGKRRPTTRCEPPASSGHPSLYPRTLDDVFPDRRAVVATIRAYGIASQLPGGFEAKIFVRDVPVGVAYAVAQFATFPLPATSGTSGAVPSA